MAYSISENEKKYYSESYGVQIKQDGNGFSYFGSPEQISKVSTIIKRDKFVAENKHKIPKFTSKKGSLSSQLASYDTSSDYDSVKNSKFSFNSYEKTSSFF